MPTSRDAPPTPEDRPALELRKLGAEVGKLEAEVPKLRNDNRLLNRHVGALVSAAAVIVSAMSLANTWLTSREQGERTRIERAAAREQRQRAAAREQRQREEAEARRQAAERSLRCVDVGMQVAAFTREQVRAVGREDRAGVELLANTVIGLFPPGEAAAILRAMRVNLPEAIMGEPSVQTAWEEVLDQLEEGPASGCDRARDLRLALPAARPAQVATAPSRPPDATVPRPTAPAAEGSSACPAPGPSPPGAQRLLVFTQIVQGADRDLARRILERAAALEPGFNRAPIEDVRARNPDAQRAEVRYYFPDQRDEAERLVALIRQAACLEGVMGPLAEFRATFLGNRFQNLPLGRIELWLPRLTTGGTRPAPG